MLIFMKQLNRLLALLLIIVSTSCHFNSQFINRMEDKDDGEKITSQFFELIMNKRYSETKKLFSPQFLKVTPWHKMENILLLTSKKLGNLKTTGIDKWETRRVEGSDPFSEYNFTYRTHYEKFDAVETFRLVREGNGVIRILAYNVNSDGFMQ